MKAGRERVRWATNIGTPQANAWSVSKDACGLRRDGEVFRASAHDAGYSCSHPSSNT